jgi:hypothetical protein
MKLVLLSLCLFAAGVSAPTTPDLTRATYLGDVATGTATPSTLNCIRSTELAVLPPDRHEVHAVVVDIPKRASLSHAAPETWDTLPMSDPPYESSPPMSDPPYESSPATTVLQVALN